MIWHPAAIAIWLMEITAWLVYLGAVWRLLRVLSLWNPGSNEPQQLWCERALELTRFQGGWTAALLTGAFLVLVAGISNLWPRLVPGAMCGTGVLQAMGPPGTQTLLYRGLTLMVLYCWYVVARIDGCRPEGVLALLQGRLLLMVLPFMALGSWTLSQALSALTSQAPVSCCAVLYAQVAESGWGRILMADLVSPRLWIAVTLAGSALVAFWGLVVWRFSFAGRVFSWVSAGLVALWLATAFTGLKVGIAPYIYEVLRHPCPWCFFLVEHNAIGFPMYGAMAVVVCEAMAGLVAASAGRRYDVLTVPARRRSQQAGRNVLLSAGLFMLIIATPVVLWRVRFGGWID